MTQVSSYDVHGVTLDPVCGATLAPGEAIGPVAYRGLRYHFCSHRCQSQFLAKPPRDLQRELRVAMALATAIA